MIRECGAILAILCVSVSFGFGNGSTIDSKIAVNKNGNFVDDLGRIRFFHGFNAVNKVAPWYPDNLLNVTKLKLYEDWGFNAVRLGTMWSGVMPRKDQVNQTYMTVTEGIIDSLAEHGMYSLLDMHQDVISSKFGSYDGVPRWLIDSFPDSKFPFPLPFRKKPKAWADGYLTVAVSEAFQHLYNNQSGALTHWATFWKTVAAKYGSKNSVLGYELINEPWAGNIYEHPTYILPGEAGRHNLQPSYDYLYSQITEVDNKTLIFYEPVTWAIYAAGKGAAGLGFDHVPGHDRSRAALSYHYYCWALGTNGTKEFPAWLEVVCDDVFLRDMFRVVEKDGETIGGARMLTEFGLCAPDKSNHSVNTVECETVLSKADEHLQSWTYWDSQFFVGDGEVNWPTVRAFSRAYPRAVAGKPIQLSFDLKTSEFRFTYELDNNSEHHTEIFLPMSVHYPNGAAIAITPLLKHSVTGNILSIFPSPGFKVSTTVQVIVMKKYLKP